MGLIDALLGTAASRIVGLGIESAGKRGGRPRLRGAILVITLLGAVWIAVSSALLWSDSSRPNMTGLWQFAQTSGPGWVLATPVCAALLALVLILPVRGRFTFAAFLAVASSGLGIASLATWQRGGQSAISTPTLIAMISSFVVPLLTLLLAFGDAPPIDSFAARLSLVYWGRLRHLRALKHYGLTHGYTVFEPTGAPQPLILTGYYDSQHPITIASDAAFKLSTSNASTYSLSIKMGSPRDIVSMRISSRAIPKPHVTTIVGQTGARLQRKLYFAVVPEPTIPAPPQFPEQLVQLVEAGRPYLRLLDFVQATTFGIRYTHASSYGLTPRDAQLDPLLQWMHTLITELEPISPTGGPPSPSGA